MHKDSNMGEAHFQPFHESYNQPSPQPKTTQLAKVATAVTGGGSLFILSALLLAATIIGLAIITPLFVIFSPVLLPAVVTVALLSLGFLASGGFGVAAVTVLTWLYGYVTGEHPPDSDQVGTARHKLLKKSREIKDYGGEGAYSAS